MQIIQKRLLLLLLLLLGALFPVSKGHFYHKGLGLRMGLWLGEGGAKSVVAAKLFLVCAGVE